MTSETNNAPRVELNAEQKAARDAALKAAQAADKPAGDKPAVTVTVDHKPATLPVDKVATAVAGQPAVLEALKASVLQAHGVTAPNKPADMSLPVSGDRGPAPAKATSEAPKPDNKASDAAAKLAADHNKAIAKANAATGKPPQGGKASGTVQAKAGGKPSTPKVDVSAAKAKPKRKGKQAAALANPQFVRGYDLTRWPQWLSECKPSEAAILAFRAFNLKRPVTKNELAGATYLMPASIKFNVYDIAEALMAVCGGSPDHKMNTMGKGEGAAKFGWVELVQAFVTSKNPDRTGEARARVAYHGRLTDKARKVVIPYLELHKVKVPAFMLPEKAANKPAGNGNTGKAVTTAANA